MAESTGKGTKVPTAREGQKKSSSDRTIDLVGRTAELSDEVLASVASGQRAAIAAVRRFVDTVDEALPAMGDRPTKRDAVIDAALDMADKLVTTQYEFLRSVVQSANRTVSKAPAEK